MMIQKVLHVLLECFINLSDRKEKYAQTIGNCVSVIMSLFELMLPKHYHMLRNTLLDVSSSINLEVTQLQGAMGACMCSPICVAPREREKNNKPGD